MKDDVHTRMLLSGNHAVAWAARLARPQVAPFYPITPQTPILEKIFEFHAAGDMPVELLTPESEHSAMAAAITASATGARVFTASAAQGLLLMHELLHYAAGARVPIVMFNVNRTVASPWGFWPDQTDSLAQRDTGWIQIYTESAQESLDTLIQTFKLAEQVKLPAMVCHEAFYVSHAMEPVWVPAQQLVDEFLPPLEMMHKLDTASPESFGNVVDQETYHRSRVDLDLAMDAALEVAAAIDEEWRDLTDRGYGLVERYRCEDARRVIVAMGSLCGTARDAVDALRDAGEAVGLVKIRLFRPFPVRALRDALAGVVEAIVLDRSFSPGLGGIVHQEVRAAMYGVDGAPRMKGLLTGVGGVDVSPEKIMASARQVLDTEPDLKTAWN